MESFVSTPLSADEYRQKLQDLKLVLDEQSAQITDESIKDKLQLAYGRYELGYAVMAWNSNLSDEDSLVAAFNKAGVAVPDNQAIAVMKWFAPSRDAYLHGFWGDAKNAVNEAEGLIKN
jgi:hypothetical protein